MIKFFAENINFQVYRLQLRASGMINFDGFVKNLILLAPQAILGLMIRLAKSQELGLMPSNSLQFFTPISP